MLVYGASLLVSKRARPALGICLMSPGYFPLSAVACLETCERHKFMFLCGKWMAREWQVLVLMVEGKRPKAMTTASSEEES